MLNIDLEPLKQLYEEILNTQALSEKELKELKELIDKLNDTKEEFDSSSFAILKKNKELFDKSDSILTKISDLNQFLEKLENNLKEEKVNFDTDIKQKFDNLINSLNSSINSLNTQISTEKSKTEREFKSFRENIENELKDTKKVILREKDELETIRKQYAKKLENSLNEFKKKIDEYDEEIAKKTFFQRWGAVIGAFALGVAISFAFFLLVPTINKTQLKANPKATYKTEYFCTNKTPIDLNLAYFVFNKGKLIPVYNLDSWNGVGILFKANETKKMMGFIKYKDKIFYEVEKGKYLLPTKETISCYSKKVEVKSQ